MVGKKGARRLDVADARKLQLEPYARLVALAAEFVHLRAQFLGGIGGLALERRNLRVALGEQGLVVRAGVDTLLARALRAGALIAFAAVRPGPGAPWSPPRALGHPMPPACPQLAPAYLCHRSRRVTYNFWLFHVSSG